MESVEKVYSAVMEHYGRIDILFNNAGAIRREDSLHFTEKDWDDVMNLNIKTLFFLTQRVAGQMIRNQIPGKIVNTASSVVLPRGIRTPSYTAPNPPVRGITMTLANEWAQYGIQVNAIAPGYIATKITTAPAQRSAAQSGNSGPDSGGTLGKTGGLQGNRRISGKPGVRLYQRLYHRGRRRLDGPIDAVFCNFTL